MESLQQLVFKVCEESGQGEAFARIMFAIVMKESTGRPLASRAEPKYKWPYKAEYFAKKLNQSLDTELQMQKTSYGLAQIMGAVAREYGFNGYLPELYDKETNLRYAVKYLIALKKRFPKEEDFISSYNQGSPERDVHGVLENIDYVRDVLKLREKYFATA